MKDEKSLRVAIYGRISTKDKGQDVRNQTDQLREFILSGSRASGSVLSMAEQSASAPAFVA